MRRSRGRRHYFAGGLDLLGLWQCILAPVNPSTLEGFSFGLPAPPLGAYWPAWPLSCQRAAYGGTAETRSSGRAKRLAAVARSERPQRAWAVPAARSTAGSCLSSLWSRGGRQPQIAVVSAEWPANYTLWLFVHAKKRLVWRAASGGPALLVRKYRSLCRGRQSPPGRAHLSGLCQGVGVGISYPDTENPEKHQCLLSLSGLSGLSG